MSGEHSVEPTWEAPDLSGCVALVTGSSRGVGRGIALALGDCGATVYVTGRSSRAGETTEGLPGTVEDTAEAVAERGGSGVAVRCDHFVDAEVEALFARIERQSGRIDLLVNNAWSGYQRGEDAPFDAPFWRQPVWRWDLFAASLRGQFLASRLAAASMTERRSGLIVNVGFTDGDVPLGQVAYDVVKNASDRMVVSMARELARRQVHAVALHPGFVRTERVEAAWALLGEGPAQVVHSPEYVGRAVAELTGDEGVGELSGSGLAVGDLASRYGFTDVDGRCPPAFRLEGRITLAARMERLNRVVARAAAQDGAR
jgi:NAD(P)-dependent dehydrogenase (short-subunit alcohol dehydrogenase family)